MLTAGLRVELADHGGDAAYPALAGSLPRYNGGGVLPDQARACLEELDRLSEAMRKQFMVVVVDLSDGAVIHPLVLTWPSRYGTGEASPDPVRGQQRLVRGHPPRRTRNTIDRWPGEIPPVPVRYLGR